MTFFTQELVQEGIIYWQCIARFGVFYTFGADKNTKYKVRNDCSL